MAARAAGILSAIRGHSCCNGTAVGTARPYRLSRRQSHLCSSCAEGDRLQPGVCQPCRSSEQRQHRSLAEASSSADCCFQPAEGHKCKSLSHAPFSKPSWSSGAGTVMPSAPGFLALKVGLGCQASAWLSSTGTVRRLVLLKGAEQLMPASQLSDKGVQPRRQG